MDVWSEKRESYNTNIQTNEQKQKRKNETTKNVLKRYSPIFPSSSKKKDEVEEVKELAFLSTLEVFEVLSETVTYIFGLYVFVLGGKCASPLMWG